MCQFIYGVKDDGNNLVKEQLKSHFYRQYFLSISIGHTQFENNRKSSLFAIKLNKEN